MGYIGQDKLPRNFRPRTVLKQIVRLFNFIDLISMLNNKNPIMRRPSPKSGPDANRHYLKYKRFVRVRI